MRAAAVLALGLAFLAGAGVARAQTPNAADLEAELVCPVCKTTLDQSNAPVAERMKSYIRARIAAGDSAQEIKDALVAEFGPGVIARPPQGGFGLLAWLLPLAVVLVSAVVIGALLRSWSRRRTATGSEEEPLDPALERRVDEELARFDA